MSETDLGWLLKEVVGTLKVVYSNDCRTDDSLCEVSFLT